MAKNTENKALQLCGGGVNPSSRATFGLDKIKTKCSMTIFRKALAFTLAEVLVVLGIIGVVSALTLPNLNQNTANKESVAKFKKVYSELTDAVGRAIAEYGPVNTWYRGKTDAECKKIFFERISENMRLTKTCAPYTTACYGDSVNWYTAITADGTSIWFGSWSGCSNTEGANDNCGKIYVDIDGPKKGKKQMGKDRFRFSVTKRGLDYDYTSEYLTDEKALSSCLDNGWQCERWIMQNDNMDYLKADKTGKCPNGRVLNWTTNTSCK